MHSRLLSILVIAAITSGGLILINKEVLQNYSEADLVSQQFGNWQIKYAKKYTTSEEEFYRLAIFADNLEYIREQNSAQDSYTLGANQFADISQEEFRAIYLGYKPLEQPVYEEEGAFENLGDVDWRAKNAVTAVKDQGQCGSCWAFSSTGSLESSYFLFGKVLLPSLSESQLVDCSRAEGNQGCNGGLMDNAFKYAKAHPLTTEAEYPYKARTRQCNKEAEQTGTFGVKSFTDVAAGSASGLQKAVTQQPVSVAVDANNWQLYTGGIFKNCKTSLDHGVLAVGFTATNWIVKNSWGPSWGEEGYIRLAAGNTCGIAASASWPSVV